MKIFYISGATFPSPDAKAVHVVKMCEAFGNAGHEVTLFAKGDTRINPQTLYDSYDVKGQFTFALAPLIRFPILSGITRLRFIPEKMKSLGMPDLLYGRDPIALALFTPPDIPVIYEAHQILRMKPQDLAIQKLIRHESFSGIVAISEALKKDLLEKYKNLKPEQVFVAHDAADLPHNISGEAEPRLEIKGRKSAPKIGYAGTLHPGKGISMILNVAPLLPEFDFHVIGGSRSQIHKIKKSNPAGNIIFYGHQDHSDVQSYLKAFDVVLAPYQHQALIKTGRNISRWISPMKVFEYMAAQRPLIASDLPVLREVLQNKKNALLVSPNDPLAWAEAIQLLVEHKEIGEALSQQAFDDLKKKFTWDTRVETVLEFAAGKKSSIIKSKSA